MKFNRYETLWDRNPHWRRKFGESPTDFYNGILGVRGDIGIAGFTHGDSSLAIAHIAWSESNWIKSNRPFYKVWPSYVYALMRTRLDLPADLVRAPHETFGIFLPSGLPILESGIGDINGIPRSAPGQITSLLCGFFDDSRIEGRVLTVVAYAGSILISTFGLPIGGDQTVEVGFEKMWSRDASQEQLDNGQVSTWALETRSATEKCTRLAVAVALLAVSAHRCVEHDVIASLRERYDRAVTDEDRERLAAKSRKRGTNGWRIGRGRGLSLTTAIRDDEDGIGRHLSYQHIRGGHFHTYLTGKGRTKRKVKFVEPTIVRPDLPAKPVAQAAHIHLRPPLSTCADSTQNI